MAKRRGEFSVRKIVIPGLVAICLAILSALIVYVWQHHKIGGIENSLAKATQSDQKDKRAEASLTRQLNQANQTINSLATTNDFQPGGSCQTQQLSLAQAGHVGAAAGNRYMLWSYENTSKTTCVISGYPGFLALDSAGHVMPNGPVKTEGSINQLTLNPNDKAYFYIHWDGGGQYPNEQCFTTSLIESTPPSNTYPLLTIALIDMCSGYIGVSSLGTLSDYANFQ